MALVQNMHMASEIFIHACHILKRAKSCFCKVGMASEHTQNLSLLQKLGTRLLIKVILIARWSPNQGSTVHGL